MNILWLSWRDVKNPASGGAEKVAIEVASRFAQNGNNVTLFTSRFKSSKSQETIRRVKIVRRGNLLTCRLFAFLYYIKRADEFNLLIDEINTIPFFSTLYVRNKTVTLIHQLAKEYWFKQTFWPINILGYLLESPILKLYKNSPTLALGASTRRDLDNIGFTQIKTYRPGIDFKPQLVTNKNNLILFIGRLNQAKKPEEAIIAFRQISLNFPYAKLSIIGRGEPGFVKKLQKITAELKLKEKVKFEGYVSQKDKVNLLKKAKIMLIPSVREGWGLVATEAQAFACVPVAYNVPGIRDAIENNHTGILTNLNPESLANSAISLLKNEKLRSILAQNGYQHSLKFSWENCYRDIEEYVKKQLYRYKR